MEHLLQRLYGVDPPAYTNVLHCVSKKTLLTFLTVTSKTNYQILIIFGINIPDTICHQISIQFPTSPSVCFSSTWGKHNQRNITFLSKVIWLLN